MKVERILKAYVLPIGILAILAWGAYSLVHLVQDTTEQAVRPLSDLTGELGTQVAKVLHPTPTILPDPVTIVHEVRSLARLETIQYTVEKVVTADTGQEFLKVLFGDRLLLVAHGFVIAGVDLAQIGPEDLWVEGGVLYVQLPEAEIFVATLDNEKSYIYDRQVGFLRRGDVDLETAARRVAEEEIEKGAIEDGILDQAKLNAENFLSRMLMQLGFPEVIFVEGEVESNE
jgi:hypothetical protein